MMKPYQSITGNYKFYKDGRQLIVDRENPNNRVAISKSSALAFHKSIIGICELSALESVENATVSFRISKAVQTYYIVYHLFTAAMLLYDEYAIKSKSKIEREKVRFEVYGKDLNSPNETAMQWDSAQKYETDFATSITHSDIKSFCKTIRNKKNQGDTLPSFLELLYAHFIKELEDETKSIKCLYNKLCYVRDRAIYRPSFVVNAEDGLDWQTSLAVRKEIDDLPSSVYLFKIIKKFFSSLDSEHNNFHYMFLFSFWHSPVECDSSDFRGYDVEDKKNIEYCDGAVSSYLCHLMELEDKERVLECKSKYWDELKKINYF